ncbi:MAG: helix-turn-helix transcriptional regulator [Acidimicrobiia bacterium]
MASDRTAKRLTRILAVLPWIIANDGADVDDVVQRFGYQDSSDLIKDLHLVFATGLPGYGPGDLIDVDIFNDEVFVDAADYFSQPVRLTPAEALGLLAAGLTLVESGQAPPALISAVDKVTTAIGGEGVDAIHFDVPTPDSVSTIRDAIDRSHVVRIGYVGLASNVRTERDVEGWDVTFSLGNWYLRGYCRMADDERVFRIDRIDTVTELDETYTAPQLQTLTGIGYQPSESDSHVAFTVAPSSAWVAEYFPVDSTELDDGSLRIRMSVADPKVAARLLIQLGSDASDAEGSVVTEATDSLRNRILTRYSSTE